MYVNLKSTDKTIFKVNKVERFTLLGIKTCYREGSSRRRGHVYIYG